MPLHQALFLEPNPTGPKYALSLLGKLAPDTRLPMVPLTEPTKRQIEAAMRHAGLIN